MKNVIYITCIDRSPCQSLEKLDIFCSNLDLLLSNINDNQATYPTLIGDFNVKCSKWGSSDKDNREGKMSKLIAISAGYS